MSNGRRERGRKRTIIVVGIVALIVIVAGAVAAYQYYSHARVRQAGATRPAGRAEAGKQRIKLVGPVPRPSSKSKNAIEAFKVLGYGTLGPADRESHYAQELRDIFGSCWAADPFEYLDNMQMVGKGAAGMVYAVISKETGEWYALKEMDVFHGINLNKRRLRMIANEINAMNIVGRISVHPNVVEYHGCFVSDRKLYFLNEHVHGLDFYTMRKYTIDNKLVLSSEQVAEAARQIFAGLEHMHRNNVLHRDVKPGNVMVRADGTVKLIDFSLSVSKSDLDTRDVLGTYPYLAPEIKSKHYYSEKSDVWAAAAVVYELLFGQLAISKLLSVYSTAGHHVNWTMLFGRLSSLEHLELDTCCMYDSEKAFFDSAFSTDCSQRMSVQEALKSAFCSQNGDRSLLSSIYG